MRNPEVGEVVEYIGGFPEFEGEDWQITAVFNEQEIEVFGQKSWRLLRKSRVDFERKENHDQEAEQDQSQEVGS